MKRSLMEEILARKAALGQELLILTHHYQRQEIVSLGDVRGDSFALSRKAAASGKARFIVFCGVHFMAESAAILAQPHQTVQIPDPQAGCLMADMVDLELVSTAWEELSEIVGQGMISPIVYMNSDASLKAFCGRHGGRGLHLCQRSDRLALGAGHSGRRSFFSRTSTWGATRPGYWG